MYKQKDRETPYLFKELFPFGGQLDTSNRWLKIKGLIPWRELEERYASYFSEVGRPCKDGRLIIGLMLLKHMTGSSDEELVLGLRENIYWQAFCGLEHFESGVMLDSSSLTKLRQRLGIGFMKELEGWTYKMLIDRKIIRGKGLLVDATIFPENIRYPNDISLLNEAREWIVKEIKLIGKYLGEKVRTRCREARKAYLNFAKKKIRSFKAIKRAKKQMIQFVRRNIRQAKELMKRIDNKVSYGIRKRLEIAEKIFKQQQEMYKLNKQRIEDRIVSFHKEYVRPMKRGKAGKEVEFGPKGALSLVGGYLFLDRFSYDNFCEASEDVVREQIGNYEKRFKEKPESFTGDRLYGTLKNRELMKEEGIRGSFVALGKRAKREMSNSKWFKKKQRERNRIEGAFGNGKEHYGLERILYKGKEMAEVWVRGSILGMNLRRAAGNI
jgi:hypothetical protein